MSAWQSYGGLEGWRPQLGLATGGRVWPGWRVLQPLVLRAVGVIGLSGTIVAIISSESLFFAPDVPNRALVAVRDAEPAAEPALARPAEADATQQDAAPAAEPVAPPPEARAAAMAALRKLAAASPNAAVPAAEAGPVTPLIPAEPASSAADLPAPAAAVESAATGAAERILAIALPEPDNMPADFVTVDTPPDEEAGSTTPEDNAAAGEFSAATVEPTGPPAAEDGAAGAAAFVETPPPAALLAAAAKVRAMQAAEPPPAAVWPEHATACPRDWIDVEGGAPIGASPACVTAEPIEQAQPLPGSSALQLAYAIPGGEEEMAPLPRPRPVSLPPRAKSSGGKSRWAALGLPAPPNCGEKHARWRYTDRKRGKREWYCK